MSFLTRHGLSSADRKPAFALAALLTGSLLAILAYPDAATVLLAGGGLLLLGGAIGAVAALRRG